VNWTIGQRITAGYGMAVLLLVVVAVVSIWALDRTGNAYREALTAEQLELRGALLAERQIRGANVDYLRFLVDRDEAHATAYQQAVESGLRSLAQIRDREDDAELRSYWSAAVDAAAAWRQAADRSMAAYRGDDEAVALEVRRTDAQPARRAVDEAVERAVRAVESRTERAVADAAALVDGTRLVLLITLVIATLLAIIAARLLDRSIRGPLHETSNVLASSATEILAATTQQASGAQESLAAVTQTAATADEVTQTSDQAAERARSVASSAQRAAEIGRQGREAVDESMAAMAKVREQVDQISEGIRELVEQAQAIGEINATVTDLSEQTNLLALNAAIEAARAGEQGRGFSVVAGEIKNLADQSKNATARVRQILNEVQAATSAAVKAAEEGGRRAVQGERQVNQAGETIRALAEAVSGAAQAAAQISASAGQQSTGMAQIRQAIGNIQQAAQQNLSATKQAEAASRDLTRLSNRLLDLVGTPASRPMTEA
jgi:methyl-accepting chemotaxis protein